MEILQIIKALGDENSIRVLNLLRNYELCSGEIEYILKVPKSKVISNLNKLYRFKIIIFEKRTQCVIYKINEETINQYSFLKKLIYGDLIKTESYKKDTEKLMNYKNGPINCWKLNECREL